MLALVIFVHFATFGHAVGPRFRKARKMSMSLAESDSEVDREIAPVGVRQFARTAVDPPDRKLGLMTRIGISIVSKKLKTGEDLTDRPDMQPLKKILRGRLSDHFTTRFATITIVIDG
jgi:hypothetical protein